MGLGPQLTLSTHNLWEAALSRSADTALSGPSAQLMSWNVCCHLSSSSESGTFFALWGGLFLHVCTLPAAGSVAQEGSLLGKDLMTLPSPSLYAGRATSVAC